MGSVLYLGRGMRRRSNGGAAAAARVQTHAPSLLRPGYNCWAVSRAERVATLVDAADYYKAFYEAALRARHSISILAWDFNSQTRLHFDPVEANGPPALLGEFLNWLVHRRHSLHVHVLNWDYPMVFGTDREFPPLYGFGWTPARRVHLRYDDTHPFAGCQHQKIVVIDDVVAFIGGIDLTVRRWDSPEHLAHDPRIVRGVCGCRHERGKLVQTNATADVLELATFFQLVDECDRIDWLALCVQRERGAVDLRVRLAVEVARVDDLADGPDRPRRDHHRPEDRLLCLQVLRGDGGRRSDRSQRSHAP